MAFLCGALLLALTASLAGCNQTTARLTPEQEQRLQAEGVLRRADDLVFRYTRGSGTRTAGWEDRKASIIVTRQRVIIHKNEKLGLEVTPRTRRFVQVRRDAGRVRISAGGGQSAETWSFVPPDDAQGWAEDIRAVLRRATSNPPD
jgi:hypothetical protein